MNIESDAWYVFLRILIYILPQKIIVNIHLWNNSLVATSKNKDIYYLRSVFQNWESKMDLTVIVLILIAILIFLIIFATFFIYELDRKNEKSLLYQ